MDDHQHAVADFITRAAAVPRQRWAEPRAPGKWSPAQEVEHIALVYEVALGELAGGPPARVVTSPWSRVFLRTFVLPYVLRVGRIPGRPASPREVRPGTRVVSQPALLARLRDATTQFDQVWHAARAKTPNQGLSHPYFGILNLDQAIRFLAVHTRHHTRNLAAPRQAVERR